MRDRVAIVVVNWNRGSETLACVDRLAGFDASVIVVDNGSTDGSAELIAGARPDVTLVETGANLGYAGGNNVGIRRALAAGARYVWVLNNDALPEHDALHELLAAMPEAAGCIATNSPGEGSARDHDAPVACPGCERGFHPADVVFGASLFFRAEALRDAGLFDETYFHYFEEVDLVRRLRDRGYAVGLACRAVTNHSTGTSLSARSAQALYYYVRNRIRFERRHSSTGLVTALRGMAWKSYLAPRRSVRHRDGRAILATLLAVFDAGRGRFGRRDLPTRFREPLPWPWRDV